MVLIHQCATWTAERPKKLASGSTAFINPGCEVQHDPPDIFSAYRPIFALAE